MEHLIQEMEFSKQFIKNISRGGIRFLDIIIATSESWCHYYELETKSSHQDNILTLTPLKTQLKIDLPGFECLKHPPYSPD